MSVIPNPCAKGGSLENVCELAKFNDNKQQSIINWIVVGIIIVVGDVLKLFPQIIALFPTMLAYNIFNLIADMISVGAFWIIFGPVGLLSALKLFDSLVIFLLASIFPSLLIVAFWVEVFPTFTITVILYYLLKGRS